MTTKRPPVDQLKIGEEIAPGTRIALRRDERGERAVAVRFLEEGKALTPGSEIATTSDPDEDGWRDLKSTYKVPFAAGDGPAQVATPKYRDGYDRIFGGKQKAGEA